MKQRALKTGNLIIKLLDLFYPPFSKIFPVETYRYAATGGLNMALDIFLYYIFYHHIFHQSVFYLGSLAISPHIASFLFVFPITFATGFFLAKFVTFTQSNLRGKKQLMRYGISVGGSILLNYLFLKLFVEIMHIYPTPSKMLTTIFVVIYSYLVQKYFTFQTGKKQLAR